MSQYQPTPASLHQPFVHDLVGLFHAPVQAWSQPSGTITGVGAEGIYLGDTRVVSALRCTADGAELSPLGAQVRSAREVEFRDVVSTPEEPGDPLLTLQRRRTAGPGLLGEQLRVVSDDPRPRRLRLRLAITPDDTGMALVRDPRRLAEAGDLRPAVELEAAAASWPIGTAGGRMRLVLDPGASPLASDGEAVTWTVDLDVPARGEAVAAWQLVLSDPALPFVAAEAPWAGSAALAPSADAPSPSHVAPFPSAGAPSAAPSPSADPVPSAGPIPSADPSEVRAARRLLRRALSDLDALRLQVPGHPEQAFFAAGAPWYFTLFGRDSLLTALLALPVDRGIAETTLRTLARRQGTEVDVRTAQQPGKILHEVRAPGQEVAGLPPVYYGTIDATPLWIMLLAEARAADLEDAALVELAPTLEAAASWLLEHADADGDGLLEYLDDSGRGLANQGWKDSEDSIRFADGSLATGAIAPAEVQGYAYEAALHAAELLEDPAVASRGGADGALPRRLREWAGVLRRRFHESFWCEDAQGPFVALALDGAKRPVDGVASNMGHLLGSRLLSPDQEQVVVDRLLDPSMFSGFGIRTLSTDNGGYGPLRYHGGSVWTHDTGVVLRGMLRSGFRAESQIIARGLLRAADGFDLRLPELFSGEAAEALARPVPFPASCRPQAWAAATAVPVAQALGALPSLP